jgi:hypothetical protein
MVAVAEASIAPPPLVPAVVVEVGETATEATAPQAVQEPSAEAVPSGGDMVMVLDEDLTPPPSSGSRNVVMTPAPEPTPAVAATDSLLAAEVPEPSFVAEVPGPLVAAEVAESSSARDAITVEELMELATCWYIDFLDVEVIDLEAPQLPEKVLEVATERMFSEPSIMDTITSVLKALQEYERVGGFAPAVAVGATDAALEAPATNMEPTADASVLPPAGESREASLPHSAEAAEAPATIAETGTAVAIVGEAGSSPPRLVAAGSDEVRALDKPAAAVEERVRPRVRQGPPPRRTKRSRRHVRPCRRAQEAVKPEP